MRKIKQNPIQQMWFDFGDITFGVMEKPEQEKVVEPEKPICVERCDESVEEMVVDKEPSEYVNNRGRKYTPSPDVADRVYKNPIDKKLIKEMLTDTDCSSKNVSAYVRELNKLVDVVFNKHFSKYFTMKEDLEADAVLAVYNKRQYYNPNKDAYNFVYSILRNEITNKLSKLNRISLVEDYMPFDKPMGNDAYDTEDMPQKVLKWTDYMLGDVNFNYVKIPKKDILEVMVYLKIHERGQHPNCLPTYLKPSVENMNALYKLLKLVIG